MPQEQDVRSGCDPRNASGKTGAHIHWKAPQKHPASSTSGTQDLSMSVLHLKRTLNFANCFAPLMLIIMDSNFIQMNNIGQGTLFLHVFLFLFYYYYLFCLPAGIWSPVSSLITAVCNHPHLLCLCNQAHLLIVSQSAQGE